MLTTYVTVARMLIVGTDDKLFSHQKATASMERDENYVPYTRSQFQLPDEKTATPTDYAEIFEETPIYTATRMFIMQAL